MIVLGTQVALITSKALLQTYELKIAVVSKVHPLRSQTCMAQGGMNASFIQAPLKGNISMVSQSGSLGCALIDGMRWDNLGISKFANIGNGVDISFTEILAYFKEDPNTRVIAVYTENLRIFQGLIILFVPSLCDPSFLLIL